MPDITPSQNVQATPESTPAPAAPSTSQADNEPSTTQTPSSTSLEDLQRQIAELRRENASHRRKAKDHEDAANTEAQKRMAEQGQYKELAEQNAAQIRELAPIAERYTALTALVAEQIDAETRDWPKSIKALDPGPDAGIEQRLAWRNKAREIVADLARDQRASSPGNGPNPKPSQPTRSQQVDELKSRFRTSGSYGF